MYDNKQDVIGCMLCEAATAEVEFQIKSEDKNGYLIAEGILQEGDEVNRNRRYYPTDELRRSIMSSRTQELVESGNLKGEAGHPTDTSLARQAKVDPTLEQVWYTSLRGDLLVPAMNLVDHSMRTLGEVKDLPSVLEL